jgi:hypothetical protein
VRSSRQTENAVFGIAMLALTWLFNLYWFTAVVGCLERNDEFPCLWMPFMFYFVQLVACVFALCVFPRAGFWGAFREVVQFFLFILALLLGFWVVTSCQAVRFCALYQGALRPVLFDRVLMLLMPHCAA